MDRGHKAGSRLGGSCGGEGQGEDKSVYCQPYDKMNWQILYIVENNSFLENTPYLWLYMILILVTVAFSVAMLLFSSRVMTKRLVQLTKAVRQVDKDHLVLNTEISGNDEVGVLSSFLQETLEMVRQLIRDNQKIEKERYAMELQSLQEQINPHFLYNALSAIAAMAYDIEAYWIRDALLNLADFYRLSLSHGADTIRLQDELHILDSYLAICRLRFDSQLDIRMDIGPETVELYVPKLIIQPFIENAVFHGNAGSIQMSARCVEDHLLIMIQDDGTGMNEEQIRSAIAGNQDGKHALQNIQRRLRLRYGEPYGLSIESQPGQGTTVTLTLPCQRSFRRENELKRCFKIRREILRRKGLPLCRPPEGDTSFCYRDSAFFSLAFLF
ncbi:MAG: sensor histidine kinase [Clostridia bacterium]